MSVKTITLRSLLLAVLALQAGASQACRAPKFEQLMPAEEQLGQATDVALAQVISATPLDGRIVEYRFLVLERLAGPERKTFTLTGYAGGDAESSFHGHRDFTFWARGGGRTMNEPDCVIHPSFTLGATYLVFLDAPSTWRSYERIDTDAKDSVDQDDKWLAFVRAGLTGSAAKREDIPDYERIGRFIYGFHRILSRDAIDRKALSAAHAPDELLRRAGNLSDAFDSIIQRGAKVADAEIAAALREAAELAPLLQAWRDKADH